MRRVIRDAKKNYWRNYCNTIGEKVDGSEVWGMIRKMGGFKRKFGIPVLNNGERIAVTNNGTPQGSVCRPVLFNIMMNYVFQNVKIDIGRSLYADDGAIWKRGHNVSHVTRVLQSALNEVEKWANKWSFRLSVTKTQLVCFAKRNHIPEIKVKLYGRVIEQVKDIRYLGIWMDSRLTFRIHIQKLVDKCKKSNNILQCLT